MPMWSMNPVRVKSVATAREAGINGRLRRHAVARLGSGCRAGSAFRTHRSSVGRRERDALVVAARLVDARVAVRAAAGVAAHLVVPTAQPAAATRRQDEPPAERLVSRRAADRDAGLERHEAVPRTACVPALAPPGGNQARPVRDLGAGLAPRAADRSASGGGLARLRPPRAALGYAVDARAGLVALTTQPRPRVAARASSLAALSPAWSLTDVAWGAPTKTRVDAFLATRTTVDAAAGPASMTLRHAGQPAAAAAGELQVHALGARGAAVVVAELLVGLADRKAHRAPPAGLVRSAAVSRRPAERTAVGRAGDLLVAEAAARAAAEVARTARTAAAFGRTALHAVGGRVADERLASELPAADGRAEWPLRRVDDVGLVFEPTAGRSRP